ncbi:hypothetical protein WR25_22910 [Diploscapter pachys]|uniref:Phytanoyl-CoA dioxygenase n=1 Tax=Diploscapter pachys TaxID=2018661 RepID=A0A2A2L2Z9_9BILA|nr:hypothetical protein WR25_22910 [Diploscapter pachys]
MSNIRQKLNDFGYAVVDDVLNAQDIEAMKLEMNKIVGNLDIEKEPKSVFSTYDEDQHVADNYFLNSSDKIAFFYEEGAFDKNGKLQVDKTQALNKVGHGLHVLNDVFKRVTFHPKVKAIFKELNFEVPEVVQSMYIFKQPRIGGAVTPHIDATFLYVEPIEHLVGVWIAVDDAKIENGCLSFIPESHKVSNVDYRFVRTHSKEGKLVKFIGEKPTYDDNKFEAVPIKKGKNVEFFKY